MCWLLIHQHPKVFLDLQFAQTNEDGSPRRVDEWTQVLSIDGSYYDFVRLFIFPNLNFISSVTLPRLLKLTISNLKVVQCRKGDYYFSNNYTIIILNGFCDKQMKLPFFISKWIFAMEVTR